MIRARRVLSAIIAKSANSRRATSTAATTTQASKAQQASEEQGPADHSRDSQTVVAEKTQSELDAELKEKLEAMSGGGGISGLELEEGNPVAMKRGTRENMFRLI